MPTFTATVNDLHADPTEVRVSNGFEIVEVSVFDSVNESESGIELSIEQCDRLIEALMKAADTATSNRLIAQATDGAVI